MQVHNLGDEPNGHNGKSGMAKGGSVKLARGGMAEEEREEHEGKQKGGRVKLADGGNLSAKGSSDKKKAVNVYNAAGSPTMKESENETPSFSKGGTKRKAGGTTEGYAAGGRIDHQRRAAGGATKSPYSTGANLNPPTSDRPGRGYEGGKPA